MTGSPSRDDGLTLERGRAHRRERAESPSRDRGVTLERSRSHPREIAESPSREDGRTVERGQAHRRERTGSPSREDRLTVERGQAHRRELTGAPSRADRLTVERGRAHRRERTGSPSREDGLTVERGPAHSWGWTRPLPTGGSVTVDRRAASGRHGAAARLQGAGHGRGIASSFEPLPTFDQTIDEFTQQKRGHRRREGQRQHDAIPRSPGLREKRTSSWVPPRTEPRPSLTTPSWPRGSRSTSRPRA